MKIQTNECQMAGGNDEMYEKYVYEFENGSRYWFIVWFSEIIKRDRISPDIAFCSFVYSTVLLMATEKYRKR